MTKYNFKGNYGKEARKTIVFSLWKNSKEELIAEIEPFDYYGIKKRYANLEIVSKED